MRRISIKKVVYSVFLIISSCTNTSGVYPLSNDIYLWDVGTNKERIIVYCEKKMTSNTISAIPVVPSNEQYQENAQKCISEYVVSYSSNQDWLVAQTIASKDDMQNNRYWLLHFPRGNNTKKNDIQDSTIGPLDFLHLKNIMKKNNVPDSLMDKVLDRTNINVD